MKLLEAGPPEASVGSDRFHVISLGIGLRDVSPAIDPGLAFHGKSLLRRIGWMPRNAAMMESSAEGLALMILGMHRSGTSAFAGTMHHLRPDA